jgi:CRP-like cAMP-binding protein
MESSEHYHDLLVQGRMPRRLSAGEIVFNQGDHGDGMYVVRGGSAAAQRRPGDQDHRPAGTRRLSVRAAPGSTLPAANTVVTLRRARTAVAEAS